MIAVFVRNFRHPLRYRQSSAIRSGASVPLLLRLKRGLASLMAVFLLSSVLVVGLFRFVPVPTSAFMLHTHIDDLVDGRVFRRIDQRWIGVAHISKHVFAAVVASEDQLFYSHHGFDVQAIAKAYEQYRHGGKLRGASTISQQVAKNLFLSPARNFGRKALEIWFTLLIEVMWSKDRILEVYLNIAEFGDHLFGIEAASRHYFGIPAKQLSAPQAALLAATLPNPIKLRADRPGDYLYRRQDWILRQMRNLSGR